MTTLEALSSILATIGRDPPSSITSPLFPEAAKALRLLNESRRSVIRNGLWFNIETDYTLARGTDNTVNLPVGCMAIRIKPLAWDKKPPVARAGKLYDVESKTYLFSENPVALRMSLDVPFDDLPESVQQYIMIRTARIFAAGTLVSNPPLAYTREDEGRARGEMMAEHIRNFNGNVTAEDGSWLLEEDRDYENI
jgi:hypothetical protein